MELTAGPITVVGLSGPVSLRTTSGSISAEGLSSETVAAETTTGRISLKFTETPSLVEAEATSGSIEVLLPRGAPYRVLADSSAGRVNIGVATDPQAESIIDLRTTSGSITLAYSD